MEDLDGGDLCRLIEKHYDACSKQLTNGVADGRNCQNLDHQGSALVYGEVTTPLRIFEALKLCSADTFVDLGSGRGQVVLAAASSAMGPKAAIGVELVPARHLVAACALEQASSDKTSRFECGDALTTSAVGDATKIFLCNTTFGGALNDKFAASLASPRAPKLERLATLAPLGENALAAGELHLAEVSAIAATWSPSGTALYVYTRTGAAAGEGAADDAAPVKMDNKLLDRMLHDRREAAAEHHASGGASRSEMERGLLRTALMAASISDASK